MNIMNTINMWRSGRSLPTLPFAPASMIVFTLLCCVLIPASGFAEWGCASASIVCFAFLLFMTRSRAAILTVGIPSLLIYFSTGSFLIPSLLLSITVSVGAGAFLVNAVRKHYLILLIPAFFLVALALSRNWLLALFAIGTMPALAALAHSVYDGAPRLGSICRVSVALAFTFTAFFVLIFSLRDGAFSLDTVRALIDSGKAAFLTWIEDQMALEPALFESIEVTAEQYTSAAFALLPAFIICAFNFLAFSAHQINISLMKSSEFSRFVSKSNSEFIMSPAAAIAFFGSIVLMLVSPSTGSRAAATLAENMFMIFMPGLVLVGLMRMLGKYGKKRFGSLTIVFLVLLFLMQTWMWLVLMSVIGAFTVLITAYSKKEKKTT